MIAGRAAIASIDSYPATDIPPRFPGGSSNTVSKEYCKGIMTDLTKEVQIEGYKYVDWNVDSTDASGNNVPVKKLIKSVENNCDLEKSNVILMHDSDAKKTTAKALPKIIEWAQKEGYEFKAITMDALVHLLTLMKYRYLEKGTFL